MNRAAIRIASPGVETSIPRVRRFRKQAREQAARLAARQGLSLLLGVILAALLVWTVAQVFVWPGSLSPGGG